MAGSGIVWDDRSVINKLSTMNARSQQYLGKATRTHAGAGEELMRENAPWTDHTGDARAGLNAMPYVEHPSYVIVVAHGVDYGIYLETAHSGRFEIIRPTVEVEGAALMVTAAAMWAALL